MPASANPDDPALAAFVHDYIALYTRDALPAWRSLFLPDFVASSTNGDGSVTTFTLDTFYERQRASFATGKPIGEVLEDVRTARMGPLAHVRAGFVWTDGEVRRRGRLMLQLIEQHGALRVQALTFSYGA